MECQNEYDAQQSNLWIALAVVVSACPLFNPKGKTSSEAVDIRHWELAPLAGSFTERSEGTWLVGVERELIRPFNGEK